ncbi:putative zinc finger, C2H2 type [Lyophyllum shimeji]|uniref:Zinc finger, C2H2 type n=1 Tax=Lyophyllum shimeji TaxID=47721 RepID=A0A9P3PS28_LYOSH|nr:putative zinc finger, C2H2 type [Lyophyllum shimeji]
MDDLQLQGSDGSPYINEIGLQPPSPQDPQQLELYSDFNPDYSADYTGSPFSSHSDISFTNEQLAPLYEGYDPSDYDNPHSGNSLLMFDDAASSDYLNYYRSPSPGSDVNEDNHSRASSASSTHTTFHSTPNMTVAHSFEGLSFNSPNWGTQALPPHHKAPSPPRLLMPEQQPPIIINAPDDQENSDMGPRLQIVPATPVSGGDGVVNISSQGASSAPWLEVGDSQSGASSRSPSPAHSLAASTPGPSRSPSASPQPPHAPFLFDPPQRSRSKSDTQLEPPNWNVITGGEGFPQQQQQSQQLYQAGTSHPPTLGANFTFGTPSSTSASLNANNNNNAYLSPEYPEFQLGGGGGGTQLRRSKSDAGGGPVSRHRGSRSEDFRLTNNVATGDALLGAGASTFLIPPSPHVDLLRAQQHQQFLSPSMRVPELMSLPAHPTHSHSHSLSSAQSLSSHHAHAPQSHGHYRRASSGTRSERGVSAGSWSDGEPVGNTRPMPYFSPNASPRGRHVPLERMPGDEFDFGATLGVGPGLGVETNASSVLIGGGPGPGAQGQEQSMVSVSKPNVTTGRTANASQRRRKQEATFVCPVPGCGSTFTRSFNLKGHIRSHNEEKPFQCHWPGCGKGFARQHDCKRHEQLHTNYRPFNCEGCGKQFARMDALNRHLKSEGGAECMKLQEGGGTASPPSSARSNKSQSQPNTATSTSSSPASSSASSPPSGASSAGSVSTSATSQGSASTLRYTQPQYGQKMENAWGLALPL